MVVIINKSHNIKGNMRDHANVHQLVANLELMNTHFIAEGLSKPERLVKRNELAIRQMRILVKTNAVKSLN